VTSAVGGANGRAAASLLPWRRPNPRAALPSATVLLASTGQPFSAGSIALAVELAQGSRIRVVTIARIHGASFGLQHPGLMPTKKEKDAAQALVANAIKRIQRAGGAADGEVVMTRSPGRSFARAARSAGVARVIIDQAGERRLDRLETWLAGRYLRLRLRQVDLAAVSPGAA
jgi:hypothetical protein